MTFTPPPPLRALGAATVLLLAAGCSRSAGWRRADLGGAILTPSIPKPAFTFTDTRGRPYDFRRETRDRIALLYFGYTHCPDVCPLQMSHLAVALRRLGPAAARQIRVVFVTTDSVRDALPRLRSWLDGFDSSFVGLTASLDRVNAVQSGTHVLAAAQRQPDGQGGYQMGHSGLVLAFTRDDSAHVAFPPSTTEAGWVADLTRLVELGPPPARMRPGPLPAHPATN
jgi:protein SCO1/2